MRRQRLCRIAGRKGAPRGGVVPKNTSECRSVSDPSGSASDAGARDGGDSPWTVAELLGWTQRRFAQVGLPSPRVDAEHLLAHALGCSRMQLYVEHDRVVDAASKDTFRAHVKRRLSFEPVAYIEGRRGFHALGLELVVDRRVLVPRPETEHLVDWVLEELRPPPAPPTAVLDVGTGSGAIALAIKHARDDVSVVGVDISEDALDVARANARALGLDVSLQRSDLCSDVAAPPEGWAVITANLPYVASEAYSQLSRDVAEFEPRLALDGGEDGLVLVRRLIGEAAMSGVLGRGGALYLEIGHDQAGRTVELMQQAGYADVQSRCDYAGIPRIVRGFR
jgi:release factor glutamine methyltransferase